MDEVEGLEWDHLPNGDIETAPAVAFAVRALPSNVLVRIEALLEDGQIGGVQMHFAAQAAEQFAECLIEAAARCREPR